MSIDIYTLIFAALAVFLGFKLRSVLGTKTGEEPNYTLPPETKDNVVPFQKPVNETQSFKWKGFAEEGSPVAIGLDEIHAKDARFSASDFVSGAKAAYEMFTTAFAKGDRSSLKAHLSPEVFAGFDEVISGHEKRGERVDYRFIGIDRVTIIRAGIDTVENEFEVTLSFVAQAVTATYSKDNVIIAGDAEKVTEIRDIWTFARRIDSGDPNWLLVGTEDA